jgi:hypothetical protein
MAKSELIFVPDGGVLLIAECGLEIIRRRKHEWLKDLSKSPPDKRVKMTNRVWGSKFLPTRTPSELGAWIAQQITEAGWTQKHQDPNPLDIVLAQRVGLAEGEFVHTIRIVSDGRYVHAYPIKDLK